MRRSTFRQFENPLKINISLSFQKFKILTIVAAMLFSLSTLSVLRAVTVLLATWALPSRSSEHLAITLPTPTEAITIFPGAHPPTKATGNEHASTDQSQTSPVDFSLSTKSSYCTSEAKSTVTRYKTSVVVRYNVSTTTSSKVPSNGSSTSSTAISSSSWLPASSLPPCPNYHGTYWTPYNFTGLAGQESNLTEYWPYRLNGSALNFIIWCGINIPAEDRPYEDFDAGVADLQIYQNLTIHECIERCANYTSSLSGMESSFNLTCSAVSIDQNNTCFLKKGVLLGGEEKTYLNNGPNGKLSAVMINWQGNFSESLNPWLQPPN